VARVLPALLLLLVPFAYAQTPDAPDALAALDDCASRLDAGLDVGYERIAARCPTLIRTLEHSPWAAWLPADWKEPHNQLNAEGLRALHQTLARESTAATGARLLHPERVGAVLERIARPDGAEQGWWPRFKRWLRELLAPPPHDERRWWRRFFGEGSIDRSVLRTMAVVSIALLVIMALMVVTNELRVAGLLLEGLRVKAVSVPHVDTAQLVGGLVDDPQHPELPPDGVGDRTEHARRGFVQRRRAGQGLDDGVLRQEVIFGAPCFGQILSGGSGSGLR